ncbi:xanthine dehydrogenase family protein molybdopterin-binding subunit [Rhizobacter sp. OV335]|uniref:xanthine dehydrogenase family protein molybdopterin-binding subunit n=1 Tax=Rhizobacter sp. OV335 TaxID=1500264 RepID=UPI00091947B2|nr:xanthine dehydrogenase family protein molybdopterin-binding subunit [Rhizobacter sp. OV335]SHM92330.1 xanthine dehydrogenase YagR molybdenum-binding subunit [Rhizobacter sp. OV335]
MDRLLTGQPLDRTDGPLKVCGQARYAAEFTLPRMVHAQMVLSTVPSARVRRIDSRAARALPGVLMVMTHENAMRLPKGGKAAVKPPAGRVLTLLQGDQVHYNGQPVALVVAETLEQCREAARRLVITYAPSPDAVLDLAAARAKAHAPKEVQQQKPDSSRGDLAAGMQAASQVVSGLYTTPIEHHNPMEPHATLAAWSGEKLVLYDATQYVSGDRDTVAKTLGISPEQVQVICPYVGGGFGCKGSTWTHVVLAAMAARQVGRPVRLVLERPQMFGPTGNRPRTEQALSAAADAKGALTALRHEVVSETSTLEDWVEPSSLCTRMLYACENVATTQRLMKLNIATPTFTRAPGEATGTFALDSAIDELSYAVGLDPLEMRLRNHADSDLHKKLPFSSKSLRECCRVGAERFGWARRDPRPQSMRDGRWQVGWGVGTATYPTNRSAAEAVARLLPDGTVLVQSGSQDLGTGTYTIMTQVAADALGLPVNRVRFQLGDSSMPKAPVSGGSQTAASVAPAVKQACEAVRDRLIALAVADAASPLHGESAQGVVARDGWLRAQADASRGEPMAAVLARQGGQPLEARSEAKPGPEREQYSMHAFGTVFAEVRVDAELREIRVPRIVGAYGIGRLLNEKTGHSQLMGGIVWGVGLALMEETWRDARNGRFVNANLADYHVPVNADIGSIETLVVPEDDPHVNALGAKGIGEIGITGVGAAIANAVFHATGKRVRELPITLDKLI